MSLENVEDAFAVSPMQSGMLYDSLSTPDSDTYVTYVTFDIVGYVNSDILKKAWESVFARHQALRAEFHWDGLDQPLQVIVKDVLLSWQVLDWSEASEDQYSSLWNDLLKVERQTKIDLSSAPLARFTLVRRSSDNYALLWSVHHLLADGTSTTVILGEVLNQYKRLKSLEAVPDLAGAPVYQYSEHIQWLSRQDKRAALDYWRVYLEGAKPSPVKLRRKKHQTEDLASENITPTVIKTLATAQSTAIAEYCKSNVVSLSTFFHGLWALWLRECSGCKTVLFASTVSGRQADVKGMSEAVGLYLNAQPRLVTTDGAGSVVNWLQTIQRDIYESAKYDYLTYGDVLKALQFDASEQPIDTILTIGAHPKSVEITGSDDDLRFSQIKYQVARSHYSLALIVTPGEQIELSLVYHEEKYHRADIDRLLDYFESMLSHVLSASPTMCPSGICRQVGSELCTIPAAKLAEHRPVTSVHGWFESVTDTQPDEVAIRSNDSVVTFSQLDRKANQIANLLRENNYVHREASIGVLLPRGVELIAAMLGVLKSGCGYTPIDTELPVGRLQQFLPTANIQYVITTHEYATDVVASGAIAILCEDANNYSELRVTDTDISGESLAYVMYTSGSAGRPKGVKITHKNLIYSTATRIQYYKNPKPIFLLLSSSVFDSSVAGIYWCLCGGGTLVLPEPDQEKDIDSIVATIHRQRVSHTLCLPSYYQLLLDHSEIQSISSLEVVIVAGESCPTELIKSHFDIQPDVKIFNEYGPTEACVWSSVKQFTEIDKDDVTIGTAIGSTVLQVLNDHGNICPPGIEGEIVIGGSGVSPGYFNDPEQTKQKFIENKHAITGTSVIYKTGDAGFFNHQNELVFNGRIDRQLKIRGYRIEPEEIEAVLNQHEKFARSIVVAMNHHDLHDRTRSSASDTDYPEQPAARKVLIAYLTLHPDSSDIQMNSLLQTDAAPRQLQDRLDESEMSQYCSERLAPHLCPVRFIVLDRFPMLANGKVSYAGLPTPARQSREGATYPAEVLLRARKLASILKSLLGATEVHPEDNFFAIGGDSIIAIQFISQARKSGLQISVAAVSRGATISEIASLCSEDHTSTEQTDALAPAGEDSADYSASNMSKDELDDFLDSFDE